MPSLPLRTLALTALFALAACKAPESAAPPASPSEDEAHRLALAPTAGSTPVDKLLVQQQEMVRRNPSKLDNWIELGQTWVRKARGSGDPGFYLNADACASIALTLSPDDRFALGLKTLVLLNDHRFTEARNLALKVLERTPEDRIALAALSDAALELGGYREAALAAQRMVDLKPNLPSYGRAAHLRWLQGDTSAAKDFYRMALHAGKDTKDPEPYAWMVVQAALVFWNEGDYDGADAGFDVALKAFDGYAPALVGKARVALARGDGKAAADALERAWAQMPLAETAWLLGDAKTLMGDAAGAEEAYARVVKEGHRSDKYTLALFEATKARNADEALKLIDQERGLRDNLYVEDAYAWALYRAGRFAEARAASDRALALGTKDARLLYHAGAIRIAQGEVAQGRAKVKEALALNPKFDLTGAEEAKRLLGLAAVAKR